MKINKNNFNQEFSFIQSLFIDNDPFDLIDGGAPNDEYDSYIHNFISIFKSSNSEREVYEYIKNINIGGFDENNGKIIAKKIWERYYNE